MPKKFLSFVASAALALSGVSIGSAAAAAADQPSGTQVYKRPGDRDLKIAVTLPSNWRATDRRAAFLFFYNGGWKEAGASRQFDDQVAYFAKRGMVCAQADYREKSRDGVSTDQAVEDICSAIRWVRKNAAELGVDPARIAVAAGSGSIHLPLSVLTAGEIRARDDDASISPVPGAIFMFDADLDVLEPATMQRLVTRDDAASARRHFPPTIYFYGARDVLQPSAEKFVAQARAAGLPIEPFVERDGLHGAFKFSPWLEKTTARMDERLRELGFLAESPRVDLPSKAKPAGLDERVLANQARWLERHRQLAQERAEASPRAVVAQVAPRAPGPAAASAAPPATAPTRRSIVYKENGERKLELVAHYPANWDSGDRRPALLLFSGGGFNPNDPSTGRANPTAEERAQAGMAVVENSLGQGMVPVADYFTQRGVVALRVDYRKRKTDGTLADKALEDAGSAVRWIRRNAALLGIDPERVIACGGSSGGHLAAALAALDEFNAPDDDRTVSRRPDALILHSPLLDFTEGGTRATPFLAALNNDRALAERLSPARHWRKDLPPTLLFTGAKEPVFQFLCDFAERWKAAGQTMELVKGEGGHVYSLNEKSIADTLPRMENFLSTLGMLAATPRETPPAKKSAAAAPPPASYVYQTLGERKLQLAAHYPPGWKATDQRAVMLFFSGAHKVQPDANGKLPPLAAERAKLGLPIVNRGPGENHAGLCDAFAKLGLVCLRVEYRTRGRDGVLPGEDIADAFGAVRWVRRHAAQLGIDPKRVVAAGGSSGGYLAASLFAFEDRHPDSQKPSVAGRPEAIILYSPLVDWLEVGSMSESFLVVLNGDQELGAKVSPARHWRKDCPPTLVMVGSEEPPFAAVRGFAEKWKAAGAPVELFVADGGEHGFFGKPAWVERTLARTEEFLRAGGFLDGGRRTVRTTPGPAAGNPPDTNSTPDFTTLLAELRADNLPTRLAAALSLIERGAEAREAFPALAQALMDDEALDHGVAARALYARPRSKSDAPALANALAHDTKARTAAAWELSRIGPSAGDEAARALVAAIAQPDKHERNFAVLALAVNGPSHRATVPALLEVLRDPGVLDPPQRNYKFPRATAAIALGLMGAEARDAVPALVGMLPESGLWEIQRAANCFALGRLGPAALGAAPVLEQAAQDASPAVRAHAARALQAIASPDGRSASAATTTENIDILTRALATGPSRVGSKLVSGLRVLGEFAGTAKPVAPTGSRRAQPLVHESISLAIGYLDFLERPPTPDDIAREEKAGALGAESRQYLMALGGVQQGIAPVLLEAMRQGDQDPRVIAIRQLAALGAEARVATAMLRSSLTDLDWIVRREAFFALSRVESPLGKQSQ